MNDSVFQIASGEVAVSPVPLAGVLVLRLGPEHDGAPILSFVVGETVVGRWVAQVTGGPDAQGRRPVSLGGRHANMATRLLYDYGVPRDKVDAYVDTALSEACRIAKEAEEAIDG